MATEATLAAVQQLYLAYYGRPADPAGLNYWADRYEAEGQSALTELYAEFGASQEFLDNFAPYLDDTGAIDDPTGAITLLYQQMFNRDPDAVGLAYYTDLLDGTNNSGLNPELRQSSLANIAADVANGATDGDVAAGETLDATTLDNKTTVANTFTAAVESEGKVFSAADIAGAQAIIGQVTDDPTTVDTGNTEATAFVNNLPAQGTPGNTFNMTLAVETVEGTDGDDTINAPLETASGTGLQQQTLTSGDTVNGNLGLDTLNVQLNGGLTAPTISSVENINIRPLGGAPELNFANISGAQAVNFNGNVVDAELTSIGSRVELGARNITGDDRDISVGYVSTVTGNQVVNVEEADIATLTLDGGGISAMQINAIAGTTTIDGIVGTAVATALTGVTIAGPGDLAASFDGTAVDGPANLRTVDGSVATGSLDIFLNQAGLNQTVTTGSGDDRLEMSGLDANDSIDLGVGDDMLVNNGNLNAASYNVTNVETVRMDVSGGGAFTLNAGAFEDAVATFSVYAEDASSPNVVVEGLEATDVVQLRDASDIPGAPAQTLGNVTLEGRDTTGSADAISVQVSGVDGDQSFRITQLSADAYESMNLESTGEAPETDQSNQIDILVDGNLGTLTITGDRALDIENASEISTIDASAFTADLMLGLGEATHTVTGGVGDDTFSIDFDHLRANDTIDGGDGSDTLAFIGATNPDLTGANAARLGGVSNFENIGLNANNLALSIDDQTLASFTGQTINVVVANGVTGASVDASGVGGTGTATNVDASETTAGQTFAFTMSNGVDTLLGGDGDDTVTVQDDFSLSGTDTLTGGDGANTLLISDDADGATVTAADLANVTGFGTFQFESNAGQTTAITLDNSLALANRDGMDTITVEPGAAGTGKLNLNASTVGAAVSIDATGGGEADTIQTGAGDDMLTGGGANDTLTTGAGEDDVVAGADQAAQGTDTVTDMALGTATTAVDQFDMTANTVASAIGQANLLLGATGTGTAIAAATNVFVLNDKAYDTAVAIDAELAGSGTAQAQSIVFWQNGLGDVFVGTDVNAAVAGGAADIETLFMLDNTTIASVAASLNVNADLALSDIIV